MRVAVVGLGTMGLGIAQVFAVAGFDVLATDALNAARDAAPAWLGAALGARVTRGSMTPETGAAALARLTLVDGLAGLASRFL